MNAKNVCLAFGRCIRIFDYEMNLVKQLGQRVDPEQPFFMENTGEPEFNFRIDPQIFGYTESCVYLWTRQKCFVLCRETGKVLRILNLRGNRTSFLLVEKHG